ncbi:MAG: protein-export chaperone SecB [Pseudomonadota bacterium]
MNDTPTTKTNGDGEAAAANAQVQVLGQYVKDLSFENPRAPQSLQGTGENPKMQLEVNVGARKVADDVYESAITLNAKATDKTGPLYELEVEYGGLLRVQNLPDNALQPVLFINSPTLIFPFLRRLVADVTREGGFPPLMLDPVDFAALYAQNIKKSQEAGMKHAAASPDKNSNSDAN